MLVQRTDTLKHDSRGGSEGLIVELDGSYFHPSEQCIASIERHAMVVLVKILETSEPTGKYRCVCHAACLEIVTDVQRVKGWVARQDRASQRESSKAMDVDSGLDDRVPMETFVSRLSTSRWRQNDRIRRRGR
jgi:hypothetical protein